MTIRVRPATSDDLPSYTSMMQQTYESTYVDPSIGLTKACFSPEVFNSDDTQAYLRSKLVNDDTQKSWVAVDKYTVIGAIVVKSRGSECELSGFYVLPHYQGQGIGTLLWQNVLEVTDGRPITLDSYAHNKKTIQLYEHWGFCEDRTRPHFFYHWPEWPEDLRAEALYMRREGTI